jgi:hypothetical protein
MYAVHGILNPHQTVIFSRSITARVAWTKPDPPLSWLWTLTDLAKSKSEIVAENALLRKPLIILRRRVLQPAWTKTDTMILGLLAKGTGTWEQDPFIVRPEEASPLVWSELDSSALLPLRNWCCTEVIIQNPQDACSLT